MRWEVCYLLNLRKKSYLVNVIEIVKYMKGKGGSVLQSNG